MFGSFSSCLPCPIYVLHIFILSVSTTSMSLSFFYLLQLSVNLHHFNHVTVNVPSFVGRGGESCSIICFFVAVSVNSHVRWESFSLDVISANNNHRSVFVVLSLEPNVRSFSAYLLMWIAVLKILCHQHSKSAAFYLQT